MRIFSINYGEDNNVDVAAMALSREELFFLYKLSGSMTGEAADDVLEGGAHIVRDLYNEILPMFEEDSKDFPNKWTDDTGTTFTNVHSPANCKAPCPIHSPSDHRMKDWPLLMRTDSFSYGLIERTCVHGIGHPDPDSVAYFASMGKTSYGVHGCDRCCSGRYGELNG